MRQSRLLGLLNGGRQYYYNLGWVPYNTGSGSQLNENDNLKPMRFRYLSTGIELCVTTSTEYDTSFYSICLGNDGGKVQADGKGAIIEIDLNKIYEKTGKIIKKGNSIKFNIDNLSAGGNIKTYNDSFFWAIINKPIDMHKYGTRGTWEEGRQIIPNENILIQGTFSVNLTVTENYTEEARFFFEDDIQHNNPIFGFDQLLKFFHLGHPGTTDENIIKNKSKYFSGTGKIYLLIWGEPQGDRENFHIRPKKLGNGSLENPATGTYYSGGKGVRIALGYLGSSELKDIN